MLLCYNIKYPAFTSYPPCRLSKYISTYFFIIYFSVKSGITNKSEPKRTCLRSKEIVNYVLVCFSIYIFMAKNTPCTFLFNIKCYIQISTHFLIFRYSWYAKIFIHL